MKALIEEFENMSRIPMFEIDISDMDSKIPADTYYIFNIQATEFGLETDSPIKIEWDEYYSLHEHISYLYTLCQEWAYDDYFKN